MKKFLPLLFAGLLVFLPAFSETETILVNPEDILHEVSPVLYGIFLEDINCAVDGGLCAELVKNRSFENESLLHPTRADHWESWTLKKEYGETELGEEDPLHKNNPHFLRVMLSENGSVTVMNQGFGGNAFRGGIPLQKGENYDFSFFLRGDAAAATEGQVKVDLTSASGNSLCVSPLLFSLKDLESPTSWTRLSGSLTVTQTKGAVLSLTFSGAGVMDADMISCMPEDRVGASWPGGGLRRDLTEALRELHPRFLRFPGGCVTEGSYLRSNAPNWKNTVGAPETRLELANTWGGMQTMAVGFFEYFCLAEEIGALPLPVVHAGVLCQARTPAEDPLTLDETALYARDVVDLIQFALGDTNTEWGSLRAEMGHPEPFDLRYVAIGNENWGGVYFNRYEIIRNAVKEAWPEITCIVAAGPVAEGDLIRDSWTVIRHRFPEDLVDEHYYMDSSWFPAHVNRYDSYPRSTHVFLGEFAAHEPLRGTRRPNNLYAALCEAAYLTGIERNSDIVDMCCYAPLLCREGAVDWTPDLIFFDDSSLCKTPSWHVQHLFSEYLGTQLVESSADGNLFQAATRTEKELQIKAVNLSEQEIPLNLEILNLGDAEGRGYLLSGDPDAANSLVKQEKIIPVPLSCSFSEDTAGLTLPPFSLIVLKVPLS